MHGGAANSGAPFGNSNALSHGDFTRAAKQERREVAELLKAGLEMISLLEPKGEP